MTKDYAQDLAHIHNAGFGQLAEAAGPVLIDALRRSGHESGLVFDMGCGGGILSRALVDAGYQARGIDISIAMIAIARKRVPAARFEVGSILAARFTECVAVAAIGECLNYLFDAGHSLPAIENLFRRIHEALKPGGILLFDVAEPGRVGGKGPREKFIDGADWAVLVHSDEDRESQILTRRITTFRRIGRLYRRGHETHRLRLISRDTIKAILRPLGYRVRVLNEYGPLRLPKGLVGFLARKT
jgi:SAM-dependent methyltransferase